MKKEQIVIWDAVIAVRLFARDTGRQPKILIAKLGLDGHSNGAEQIACRARDTGFEVVYHGIRNTPSQMARVALEESVHLVGVSMLSGSHMTLIAELLVQMDKLGIGSIPLVAGGTIPDSDAAILKQKGVREVYTPKDFRLNIIMKDLIQFIMEAEPGY